MADSILQCDEIKPVCSNCQRRYVNIQRCEWSAVTKPPRGRTSQPNRTHGLGIRGHVTTDDDLTSITQTIPPSRITHPPIGSDTNQYRTLDLKLVYHYTTAVSRTMPFCDGLPKSAWEKTIPQVAFEYETVLFPMLALSALHHLVHSPNDLQMTLAVRQYLGKSLLKHRATLENPGKNSSEELWLSGSILSHIYWLLVHQARPDEGYELPLEAYKVMEGLALISGRNNGQLALMNYHWVEHKDMISTRPVPELSTKSQAQLQSIHEELTSLLDNCIASSAPADDEKLYREAKHYILYHYQAFYSGIDAQHLQRFIVYMPLMLHPRYRELLHKHTPLAMGLLARMLVLLCGMEYTWWVSGGGDYEVVERNVRGMQNLLPSESRWIMDWPISVLERRVILSRDEQS